MSQSEDRQRVTAGILAIWIVRGVTTIAIAAGGWMFQQAFGAVQELDARTKELELWRSEVKGNRFTASDGQEVWKEIGRIRADIAKLPPTSEPPKWLVDQLGELKAELRDMNKRMASLEASVNRAGGGK
jgi:hypothetical protein